MIEHDRLVSPEPRAREDSLDRAVRPGSLAEYVGQPVVQEQMEVFAAAARNRGEPLDHTLICGPPGLGKNTLAYILAAEVGEAMRSTSGPVLAPAGDLAATRALFTTH